MGPAMLGRACAWSSATTTRRRAASDRSPAGSPALCRRLLRAGATARGFAALEPRLRYEVQGATR